MNMLKVTWSLIFLKYPTKESALICFLSHLLSLIQQKKWISLTFSHFPDFYRVSWILADTLKKIEVFVRVESG